MTITDQSLRTIRYKNRCTKKNIENQNKERAERYERRSAMKIEAQETVSDEMKKNMMNYNSNSTYDLRSSRDLKQPLRYSILGYFF